MDDYTKLLEKALKVYIGEDILSSLKANGFNALNLEYKRSFATFLCIDIITIHFADEILIPETVMARMNYYYHTIIEQIIIHNGIINNINGDSILAVFDHNTSDSDLACKAALECIKMNHNICEKNNCSISLGIGITTGPTLVGNIGSPLKLQYSYIGDTVNLASRVQSLTKPLKENIIITETTKNLLTGSYDIHEIETIFHMKGSNNSLKLYGLNA